MSNDNTGHGHVFPRPDGVRARCGGPPLCKECLRDAAIKFMADRDKRAGSGFEPDPDAPQCRHPGHAAPQHLHIPAGQRYRHVCPACGHQEIIRASGVSF